MIQKWLEPVSIWKAAYGLRQPLPLVAINTRSHSRMLNVN
jgi:hypothetical protein